MQQHDLTHGWSLTILDNGAMVLQCDDPKIGGLALDPEQATRLREIMREATAAEEEAAEIAAEEEADRQIAERERGLDQILVYREETGL